MLRLLTRVTLGATARDGDLAAENQADNDAPLHDDEGDLNLHHFEAPDHPQIGAIHESDDHDIYDDSSTDIESESEDVDLRENLLTTRHHHRSRHSSNRVIVNRSNKHKRKQMRLTSRNTDKKNPHFSSLHTRVPSDLRKSLPIAQYFDSSAQGRNMPCAQTG